MRKIYFVIIVLMFFVNFKSQAEQMSIHQAVMYAKWGIIKSYKGDINAKDENGNTLLHMAVKSYTQADALTKYFIAKDANIEAKNNKGQTPLFEAVQNNNNSALILIRHGADIHTRDEIGNSVLHFSVHNIYTAKEISAYLIKLGISPNIRNNNGETPLHMSIRKGSIDGFEILLDKGANPNIKNKYGQVPLHYALEELTISKQRYISKLAKAGADMNYINNQGDNPLHVFIKNRPSRAKDVINTLINCGTRLDYKNKNGLTPLHYAVIYENPEAAAVLTKHRYLLDIADTRKMTALHYAVEKNNETLTSLLVKAGASVNLKDCNGDTPLHKLVKSNKPKEVLVVAHVLINNGADKNLRNNMGMTPYDIALKK